MSSRSSLGLKAKATIALAVVFLAIQAVYVLIDDRLFLTDEEYAAAEKQLQRLRQADTQETAPNTRVGTGPPEHWTEREHKRADAIHDAQP